MKHKPCNQCTNKPSFGKSLKCKECISKNRKEYQKKYHASKHGKIKVKAYRDQFRSKVINFLGGKCPCGFSDPRALHIDHVNGGGNKIRNAGQSWSVFYKEILEGTHKHPLQLLCANCNRIKIYEKNEMTLHK